MKTRILSLFTALMVLATSYAQTPLDFGSSHPGRISADDTFQTYTVDVPAGTSFLVIYLDGEDVDLDMAVKYGSEIVDYYDDADFLDDSVSADALYVVNNPQAGTYYIDVVNYTDEGSDYNLSASSTMPVGNTSLVANTTESGTIGLLAVNAQVTGSLAAVGGESASYHTYVISVPEGTSRLKIEMRGDADLDLYAKYGSDIVEYGDDGDWDHRNDGSRHRATFNIRNPQAGLWYVDVANHIDNYAAVDYSLTISTNR